MLASLDWRGMLLPTGNPVELVLRATVMHLFILAGFRMFRRDAGSLSVSDLLVVVLIADAAQNGMAGDKDRSLRARSSWRRYSRGITRSTGCHIALASSTGYCIRRPCCSFGKGRFNSEISGPN